MEFTEKVEEAKEKSAVQINSLGKWVFFQLLTFDTRATLLNQALEGLANSFYVGGVLKFKFYFLFISISFYYNVLKV